MSSRHVWPGLSHLLSQGRKSLSFSPRSPPINPDRLALDVADLEDGFGAKGLDAAGDDDPSATMVFTQLVIKRANAVSFRGHDGLHPNGRSKIALPEVRCRCREPLSILSLLAASTSFSAAITRSFSHRSVLSAPSREGSAHAGPIVPLCSGGLPGA